MARSVADRLFSSTATKGTSPPSASSPRPQAGAMTSSRLSAARTAAGRTRASVPARLVVVARDRRGHVRPPTLEAAVVAVDAVAQSAVGHPGAIDGAVVVEQLTGQHPELDVDHVVGEASPVG